MLDRFRQKEKVILESQDSLLKESKGEIETKLK